MDVTVLTLCLYLSGCKDLAVFSKPEPCFAARGAWLSDNAETSADLNRSGTTLYCDKRQQATSVSGSVRRRVDAVPPPKSSTVGAPRLAAASPGSSKTFGPEDIPLAIDYALGDVVMAGLIVVACFAPR